MRTYDIECPLCGHMNYSLYLEETNGWMECEKCGQMTKKLGILPTVKIPVYSMEGIVRLTKEKGATADEQNICGCAV